VIITLDRSIENIINSTPSRRELLKSLGLLGLGLCLPSCKKPPYRRPNAVFNLGPISEFLYEKVFIIEKKFMVHRYEDGWAALSTRCAFLGCDLTYQNNILYCPCCKSVFSQFGELMKGPAIVNLPWVKMFYKDDSFFVDTGSIVKPSVRFTTPEIEKVIEEYQFKFKESEEIDPNASKIPDILLPKSEQTISLDDLDRVDDLRSKSSK